MLNFPNQSRVFDPAQRAVRFWGYDSAMEWSFFVTEGALKKLRPNMGNDEASVLRAFDDYRNAIHVAAVRASYLVAHPDSAIRVDLLGDLAFAILPAFGKIGGDAIESLLH